MYLFALLLCLSAVPAFSHAAQKQLPEPTDNLAVSPTMEVGGLLEFLQLPADYTVTVFRPDGTIRAEGLLQNDDLAVLKASSGKAVACYKIMVEGSSSSSSAPGVSSAPEDSSTPGVSSVPDDSSTPGVSSVPNVSSVPSLPPDSAPSGIPSSLPERPLLPGAIEKNDFSVFPQSIRIEVLSEQLQEKDGRSVTAVSADGTERKSGPVCTGDCLTVGSGDSAYTFHAVILGDLTRCGSATEPGCSILYDFLTGDQTLSPDLKLAADMNLDGQLDTADLLKMKKQASSSAPDEFPTLS